MGDVADILGIKAEKSSDSGGLSSAAGAKDAPKKKKPVGMSREVFALVNALPRRPRSDILILAYQTARKYEADALLLFPPQVGNEGIPSMVGHTPFLPRPQIGE